jgi:hypothetical protein
MTLQEIYDDYQKDIKKLLKQGEEGKKVCHDYSDAYFKINFLVEIAQKLGKPIQQNKSHP